jgi:hypothetical protein
MMGVPVLSCGCPICPRTNYFSIVSLLCPPPRPPNLPYAVALPWLFVGLHNHDIVEGRF